MIQYVLVADEESEEPIELPAEEDGSMLLTTLVAQFAGASGLKYRNPETNTWRGVRIAEGRLYPPEAQWSNITYFTVYPKEKRKGEVLENPSAKTKRIEKLKCSDLIVLGLPWKSTEEDLTRHFAQFGELLMVQVKRDIRTKQSKGFGFIRFADIDQQQKALSQRHMIDGRWCDLRVPNSQEGAQMEYSQKVYVGRCSENMTDDDLRTYFSQFGEVTDVFIPRPFRAFAFVTFANPDVAHGLCGDDHIIKGTSVHISSATPKNAAEQGNSAGGHPAMGQWQSSGRGGGASSGGWSGHSGGAPGRVTSGSSNMMSGHVSRGPADYSQPAPPQNQYGTAAGFPLNPAMVAAAQVALMGLMNHSALSGVAPPSSEPGHVTGPYGSPIAQVSNYAAGWNGSGNGAPVCGSGSWKPDGSGWN